MCKQIHRSSSSTLTNQFILHKWRSGRPKNWPFSYVSDLNHRLCYFRAHSNLETWTGYYRGGSYLAKGCAELNSQHLLTSQQWVLHSWCQNRLDQIHQSYSYAADTCLLGLLFLQQSIPPTSQTACNTMQCVLPIRWPLWLLLFNTFLI